MSRFAAAHLALAIAVSASGQIASDAADLTVVVNFKGLSSDVVTKAMEQETGRILQASGIRPGWVNLRSAQSTYKELVVLTFKGACDFPSATIILPGNGPFATTSVSDGEVLPFAEVDCDRVVRSIEQAMSPSDSGRRQQLLGRALGRIVAHEIFHMLTRSVVHSHEGIEQPAFSSRELIGNSLTLTAGDLDRLRGCFGVRRPPRAMNVANTNTETR